MKAPGLSGTTWIANRFILMADGVAAGAVRRSLPAIAKDNARLRAISHLDPTQAHARAALIDATGASGPLCGLTFVAKDLIDVAGLPTSAGSSLYDPVAAAKDAPCVQALQAAGAVILGKSNMHELAVGGAHNPWFGQVINPLSAKHGTGGTSSGSAAAVAAGFCDFALGTDSGGSNRSTAAATGLFGFKPTNGILSLDGIRPVAPTLDTVGLLAKDAATLALAFAALSGQARSAAPTTLHGRVIGLARGLHGPVDATVQHALDVAGNAIRQGGGQVVDVQIDDADALAQAGKNILSYEVARNLGAEIAANPGRVGTDVRIFVAAASKVSDAQYDDALALVQRHRVIWADRMGSLDALLMPTAPGLAPRLADEQTRVGDAWVPYGPAGAMFRMWANTIGLPAVAIPVLRRGGLPASVQLAGRRNTDGFLIDLSAALGRAIELQCAAITNEGN
jgi:aspartyl-tRNA(Asn)/glutamyl-tRNA(Gln) amidotransferase subunit A